MSRQWLRHATLLLGDKTGRGLDLSALRFTFSCKKTESQTPNTCTITVYNVSDATASRIQREFSRVILQAGYGDNFGVIFDGTLKQVRRGREKVDGKDHKSSTSTYLELQGGDGDMAYNFAVVNTTLAAGASQADQVAAATGSMTSFGVRSGYVPDLGGQRLPRGRAMYGMARDYLRDSAETTGTSWSIQNGTMQMVPLRGVLPGQAVVLTAKTGLIGMPEQTNDGIKAQCLLNPALRVGGCVQIDNHSILHALMPASDKPKVAQDGFYRVLVAEHKGDTRGQDWYTELTCLALDDTVPRRAAVTGAA